MRKFLRFLILGVFCLFLTAAPSQKANAQEAPLEGNCTAALVAEAAAAVVYLNCVGPCVAERVEWVTAYVAAQAACQ